MDQSIKTKKVAIVTIHGMGNQDENYYEDFETRLKQKLGKRWDQVVFGHIYYQNVLKENEESVYGRMKEAKTRFHSFFLWRLLREFLIFFLADAASLETNESGQGSSYYQTQNRILETLQDIYVQSGQNRDLKVVIVSHSLGCQVISNYIWDGQFSEIAARLENTTNPDATIEADPKKQTVLPTLQTNKTTRVGVWGEPDKLDALSIDELEFLLLKNLYRFYTCGCNIPLFTAGHDYIVPFKKPNPEFRWLNFYSRNDVLGWPLEPLSGGKGPINPQYKDHPCYEELVEDSEIHVGKWWQFWNPLAHTAYFTDDKFINPIVKEVEDLIPLPEPTLETTTLYAAPNP